MKVVVRMSVVFLIVCLLPGIGYAFGKKGQGQQSDFNLPNKLLILKDELGLTNEQQEKLTALKYEAKKQAIQDKAEVAIAQLELKELTSGYQVEEGRVDKAVDKLYKAKKKARKNLIAVQVKVKALISKEQFDKLKAKVVNICLERRKQIGSGPMAGKRPAGRGAGRKGQTDMGL